MLERETCKPFVRFELPGSRFGAYVYVYIYIYMCIYLSIETLKEWKRAWKPLLHYWGICGGCCSTVGIRILQEPIAALVFSCQGPLSAGHGGMDLIVVPVLSPILK